MERISEIAPDPIFLLTSFIFTYGISLLLMSLGIISILVLFEAWKEKRYSINIYYVMFSIGLVSNLALFIASQFIVTGTGYGRVGYYAILFSLFLIPMALGYLIKGNMKPTYSLKLFLISFAVMIFCLSFLSVFTLYMSPITKSSGQHVTDSELSGMKTFFEKRAIELRIIEGGISVSRIKDAIYGLSTNLKNVVYYKTATIPPHFDYTSSSHLGDYYQESVYLVISALFKIKYPKILPDYPQTWEFNNADFSMLENDKSVSKIYSNRELNIYILSPILKQVFANEESINN
jgi:hypothetical protein